MPVNRRLLLHVLSDTLLLGVFGEVQLVNAVLVLDLLQDLEHQEASEQDRRKELRLFYRRVYTLSGIADEDSEECCARSTCQSRPE